MESDEERCNIQGMYPECGAIFMSSSSTKNECFRKGLFGLPSGQGPFVKQVKTGMVLFLFEFDKRELHGVFQACSDGTMNIVPNAWSRSGKKFPAQVRVKPIWRCLPLPESEFGDAIKENYFSKGKFNFGLSKAQVLRLLMLFDSRRLKSLHPQRALARNTPAEPMNSKNSDGELVDGRFRSHTVDNLHKVGSRLQLNTRGRYLERLPGILERDDKKFGNGVNDDFPMPCQGTYSFLGNRSSVFPRLDSSRQMELPITGHSYAASYGDANIMSTHPYDPDDPGFNLAQDLEDVSKVDGRRSLSAISFTPFPGAGSSAEMATYSSKFSLAPESLSESGSYGRDMPSSYPLSPSNYPAFLIDCRHPVAFQNKPVHELGPFTANVTSLEEIQHQSPCQAHSDKMLGSDLLENRSSVFSRLRFNEENAQDISPVDEIMVMLSESHYSWMESKSSKLRKRQQGNVEKSTNIKQTAVKYELEMDPEKSASASPTGYKDDKSSEKTLFLDFKRRSEVRKVDTDINGKSAGSEGLLGGKYKRRKLIRPNFSENEPRDNRKNDGSRFMNSPGSAQECRGCEDAGGKKRKLAKPNSSENKSSQESSAQCSIGEGAGAKRRKLARPNFRVNESSLISSPQCSVSEDAGGSCESFVGRQDKLFLQGADSSHDNEKINTELSSKCERETIVESSGGSPKVGDDSANECLHAYPGNSSQNLQASVVKSSFCGTVNYKKLVGLDFRENELFQVLPHECSSGQYAGGNYEAMLGNQANVDAQRFPISNMEIKPESSDESLRIGDESGKKPVHDVGSHIAVVPSNDDLYSVQEVSDHKDQMVLSRDGQEPAQSTMLESALQPKTDAGTRNGFSEIESERGSELEVLPGAEPSPNIVDKGDSRKQDSESPRVAENFCNRVDVGMINCPDGSSAEQAQAAYKSNQHDSLQQKVFKNDVLEAVEFGDNAASDHALTETDSKLQSFVDSVKNRDEHGMDSVQVVSTVILNAAEDNIPTRLSEDFTETDQESVLESATQPKMNTGTSIGFFETEGDRGSELEVLPMVELCPDINASNRADSSMENNQQGVNSEQTSFNSINHSSPQEHGSNHNLPKTIDEAIEDTVRENKRLWSILTSRLQLLRHAQRQ